MSTQNERVITVYSTQGKPTDKYTTGVEKWSELKELLVADGYNLNSLLATESIRRTDLINEDAILPEEDFTVFLRPAKTKSGADVAEMDYKELRATIKSEIESGGDAAKEFFNEGRSYTNKSTDTLRELLHDWFASNGEDTPSETIQDVLGNQNMSDEDKLNLIRQLAEEINGNGRYTVTIESVENQSEESEDDRLKKEYESVLAGYVVKICYYK